jgi:hypothetical protein
VKLDVFGIVELERSWKNGSRAVPNTPISTISYNFIFISNSYENFMIFKSIFSGLLGLSSLIFSKNVKNTPPIV